MKKFKYYYCVEDLEDTLNAMYSFGSNWDKKDDCYIADDAAFDYHDNHDGWDANFPLTFFIFTEGKEKIGTFKVQREYEPHFDIFKEE